MYMGCRAEKLEDVIRGRSEEERSTYKTASFRINDWGRELKNAPTGTRTLEVEERRRQVGPRVLQKSVRQHVKMGRKDGA